MSSGVSFGDYKQAREYQEMLLREGMNSNVSKQGGVYVVVPKEKTNIKEIKVVSQEELGEHVSGAHWGFPEGHYIQLRKGVGTRVKLHEVGHAKADHRTTGGIRTGDIIERELDAETFAYKQQGRKVDYRVGEGAIRQAARDNILQLPSVVNEVSRRMEKRGIYVTREEKITLLDLAITRHRDPELKEIVEKLKEQL